MLNFLFWVLKVLGESFGIQYMTLQIWNAVVTQKLKFGSIFGWKTQTLESLFEFHPLEQRRANCIGNQPKEFYIIIWCLKQPDIRNGWHLATNDHDIALCIFVNCTIPMWTWNESQIVPDMVQLMCWYLEDISWYIWERSDAARKCFLPNIHCIFIIHHVNNTILTS